MNAIKINENPITENFCSPPHKLVEREKYMKAHEILYCVSKVLILYRLSAVKTRQIKKSSSNYLPQDKRNHVINYATEFEQHNSN